MDNSQKLVEIVVKAADDKLAQEILALDVQALTPLTDYFVIMSGKNERQVQAIVTAIVEQAEQAQFPVKQIEGKENATWVLIDLNDIIVHVFQPETRAHYQLEKIWQDAPLYPVAQWTSGQ